MVNMVEKLHYARQVVYNLLATHDEEGDRIPMPAEILSLSMRLFCPDGCHRQNAENLF